MFIFCGIGVVLNVYTVYFVSVISIVIVFTKLAQSYTLLQTHKYGCSQVQEFTVFMTKNNTLSDMAPGCSTWDYSVGGWAS